MSDLALILMWVAVLLAPIKVAELLEPLKPHIVPEGDATSLRLEAILMATTIIIILLLSIALAPIIDPAEIWRAEAMETLFATPQVPAA